MNNARFFSINDEGIIQCTLCPHLCVLSGKEGLCRVRKAKNGILELPRYAHVSALAKDPIEKKPLYHWRPGSSIVSVGFFGCNLRCPFCQNWRISQINKDNPPAGGTFINPIDLTEEVKNANKRDKSEFNEDSQIAYTYSEPLVHAEYLLDCMQDAHNSGVANVLVTNGCVNAEAAQAILSQTDAANIDLKCFSEKTYSSVLGGSLKTVLDFITLAVSVGVHTEITTLVVPEMNDSEAELTEIAGFISELSKKNNGRPVPWHLSAYHPDWKWDTLPTNPAFLSAFAKKARAALPYVYTGNIAGEQNDTFCDNCKTLLIKRRGYSVDKSGLCLPDNVRQNNSPEYYSCAKCGKTTQIRRR